MGDELDSVLSAVGPRLRTLRRKRGLTLAGLAAATGISASTLSRLESGQRRPKLELLLPLARAHGVPLDELVGAPPTGDPRVHIRSIRRHGMTFMPLSRRAGGAQAYKLIIPGRQHDAAPQPQTHEGYEWLYVLSGQLRLVLGDQDLVLVPGEAAEFDTMSRAGWGPQTPRRPSCSSCSDRKVNALTYAPDLDDQRLPHAADPQDGVLTTTGLTLGSSQLTLDEVLQLVDIVVNHHDDGSRAHRTASFFAAMASHGVNHETPRLRPPPGELFSKRLDQIQPAHIALSSACQRVGVEEESAGM